MARLRESLPEDIIRFMGRSRRKPGSEYEDRRHSGYGRSRGREKGGAGTVLVIVAVILLMLLGAFLYLRKDAAFADYLKLPFLTAPETEPETRTAQNLNGSPEGLTDTFPEGKYIDAGSDSEYRDETETAEAQVITVAVPAKETETETQTEEETLPPPKYAENENTKLIDRHSDYVISLTFAGDILFDEHYSVMASAISRTGGNPTVESMFDEDMLSLMRDSDIFMVNNEFPYSEGGKPLAGKKYTFRANPKYAALLNDMGADIVALANNHLYDHGEEAFLDTLATLQGVGVPYVGAGKDLNEAAAPFYFTTGDIKIGFVAATQIERMGNPDTKGATETTPGVFRCLDYKKLCEVISEMRNECDFIVAYLHWGTESTVNVDDWQKKLATAVRDAGADLIIGDHPHVLQGISALDPLTEGSSKVPCIYSLGNYLFNSNSQDTCLVTAYIDPKTAKLISFRFIPARQEGCRTHILKGTEKERVLKHMCSISKAEIDEDGFVNLR